MTTEKQAHRGNTRQKSLTSRIKCVQIAIFNNSTIEEKTMNSLKRHLSKFSVLQLVRALFIG